MLIEAFVDAATMLDIAGGALQVVVGREKTGVPNEMVMTGALLEWRDRTDAKPQAEAAVQVTSQVERAEAAADAAHDQLVEYHSKIAAKHDREVVEAVKAGAEVRVEAGSVAPEKDPDDGFDFSQLEEEDVEEPVA